MFWLPELFRGKFISKAFYNIISVSLSCANLLAAHKGTDMIQLNGIFMIAETLASSTGKHRNTHSSLKAVNENIIDWGTESVKLLI